ncbi:MAG: SLC13 family permease, partial [Planctomycetota bacterium]
SLFTAPFFSDVILLFLGGFVLSAALHKYGIDERLARWVLARAGASIPRLMAGIMGITAVLSMWLSNTATTAMMLTLCLPILRSLPANDRSRKGILLAVPFAANVGGIGTPIGTPPNAIAIQYWHEIGSAPSFLRWIVATIPIVAVLLVVTWAVLLAMFRGQAKHVTIETAARASGLSRQAGFIALVAAITVAGWLTGALHGLTSGTVALLPVLLLFGSRLLDVKDLRNLSWDVLLMMGGGLCLGKGIEASGLAEWMVARVPVDGMGPFVLGAIFAVTACFMSTVMSNTASANLLLPIVVGIGATSSGSLLVGVALACSMAMALPISTPPNAIAFSSGELTARDMLRPGLVITIAGLVVVLLIAPHWWRVVGFL